MNNPARDIPRYLRILQAYLGTRMYIIFALTLFTGLAEGVGILMLIPLLRTLDIQSPDATPADLGGISGVLNSALEVFNLKDATVAVPLIITVAFLVKGLLAYRIAWV